MAIVLLLIGGLLTLSAGAELLLRGATRLAALLRISPLVVGLTVVAFGTSAPEFAVSIGAALHGKADIAIGNVVGSNIFNVLFILGISALVAPLPVHRKLIRIDVPVMIAAVLLLWWFTSDGAVSRIEGAIAFGGLLAYTSFLIIHSRSSSPQVVAAQDAAAGAPARNPWVRAVEALLMVIVGLALLVQGSNWFVDGAVQLARILGLSELVIGLTIVAAGTSLPELATSVWAAARGEREISVGNIIGSNIFNTLGVLGAAAALAPDGVPVAPSALNFDIPVMVAVCAVCLPMFFTGRSLSRWEGILLIAYYAGYTSVLILHTLGSDWLPAVSFSLAWFALPLTAAVLLTSLLRELRRPREAAQPSA